MVFSSIEFLFYFLPVTVALYFLAPRSLRNAVLLLASLFFYYWGGGQLILLLLGSIALNYVSGLLVAAGRKRIGLTLSIGGSLGLLCAFKYTNFLVEQINALREMNGGAPLVWVEIALPIGISFYTFQAISYVVDVARGEARALRNPLDFALYVSMFPQLVAGPIVRYRTVAQALRVRSTRREDHVEGVQRFVWGLFKKVAVADAVAPVADAVFLLPEEHLTTGAAWLGMLAYTLQIYFDFSGYSDMAIGLGRVFGFRFPENFDRPYAAGSVTAFWRRWHMTLSNWFRDYLYISIGGSRGAAWRTYGNLWIVFLATGFWHGAQWTFVVWGIYHGALLILERLLGRRDETATGTLGRVVTLTLVMLGWVVFRSEDLPAAWSIYRQLFDVSDLGAPLPWTVAHAFSHRSQLVLLLASTVFFLPRSFHGHRVFAGNRGRALWMRAGLVGLALPYTLMLVISGAFTAFIYFQF